MGPGPASLRVLSLGVLALDVGTAARAGPQLRGQLARKDVDRQSPSIIPWNVPALDYLTASKCFEFGVVGFKSTQRAVDVGEIHLILD